MGIVLERYHAMNYRLEFVERRKRICKIFGGIAGWLAEQFSPVMCRGWMANFGKRLAAARTRLP
jgi:hypothetical protein